MTDKAVPFDNYSTNYPETEVNHQVGPQEQKVI